MASNLCPLYAAPAQRLAPPVGGRNRRAPAGPEEPDDGQQLGLSCRGPGDRVVKQGPENPAAQIGSPRLGVAKSKQPAVQAGLVRKGSGPAARRQPGNVSEGSGSRPVPIGHRSARVGQKRMLACQRRPAALDHKANADIPLFA